MRGFGTENGRFLEFFQFSLSVFKKKCRYTLWQKFFEISLKISAGFQNGVQIYPMMKNFPIFSKESFPLAKILVIYLQVIMAMAEQQNRTIARSRGFGELGKTGFF